MFASNFNSLILKCATVDGSKGVSETRRLEKNRGHWLVNRHLERPLIGWSCLQESGHQLHWPQSPPSRQDCRHRTLVLRKHFTTKYTHSYLCTLTMPPGHISVLNVSLHCSDLPMFVTSPTLSTSNFLPCSNHWSSVDEALEMLDVHCSNVDPAYRLGQTDVVCTETPLRLTDIQGLSKISGRMNPFRIIL